MADFRRVTDQFSVAPQIALADIQAAADAGFALLINNRPEGEDPFQPAEAQVQAAAQAAGLDYIYIPVRGGPSEEQAMAVARACEDASGPVLAFCRSGTRSIIAWSLGQALSGARTIGEIKSLGASAGYDLSQVFG